METRKLDFSLVGGWVPTIVLIDSGANMDLTLSEVLVVSSDSPLGTSTPVVRTSTLDPKDGSQRRSRTKDYSYDPVVKRVVTPQYARPLISLSPPRVEVYDLRVRVLL